MQNPSWFDAFYERMAETAYAHALSHVGDVELAQDVLSEAFVIAYKQRLQLTDEKTAEDFLLRTIERHSIRLKEYKEKRDRQEPRSK